MNRPDGTTQSEKYLKTLCEGSFLSLWSHANVYRDQRLDGTNAQGKEVCDLLVVFENRIIIFSDKYCEFPDSKNLEVDWRRWYKRAVLDSAKQLCGAERWIKHYPNRLFADPACTVPLPVAMPGISEAKFHRVIVAHGAANRSIRELGGSGSLMLNYVSDRTRDNGRWPVIPEPFTISEAGNREQIIHVLDDNTAGLILGRLDTISDFVAYLDKKEKLLSSGVSIFVTGEEDLLAYYLWHMNEDQEHDFVFDAPVDAVYIEGGTWEKFWYSDQRRAQTEADRPSYLWDRLIELFTGDSQTPVSIGNTEINLTSTERVLRLLARETRFRRRMLARLLQNVILVDKPNTDRFARIVPPFRLGEPHYVFLGLRYPDWSSREEYREARLGLLDAYCQAVRLEYPEAKDIVGIATELGKGSFRSFDAMYIDGNLYSPSELVNAAKTRSELKLLQNRRERRSSELEYPSEDSDRRMLSKGRYRNASCPCGSGLKYKHCCGRSAALGHNAQYTLDG